ncbi:hypothetical protein [Flavobacterium sp.]|uniref:hypothetical protein n=1 Tax=Flavobacterium sp. TaxID=239 RepID=UPI002609A658|nr:hypothetical protein [Flavobacterium sp.]
MKLEISDLYYIPNFQFNNGSNRDKYLLVLSEEGNNKILLSLPTSKGRVPDHLENMQRGCINCDKSYFNCYRFLNGDEVTEGTTPFCFPLDTYVYGEWIQDWDSQSLKLDYSIDGIDFEFKGKLKGDLLKDILRCFIKSIKVKRKFKKVFEKTLQTL